MLELARTSDELAAAYLGKDRRALTSDFQSILDLGLVEPSQSGYRATADRLRAQQFPGRAARGHS